MSKTKIFDTVSVGIHSNMNLRLYFLHGMLLVLFSFLLTACEGFKLTGSMCESLQPGQVSAECRAYDEEEARRASEPVKDDSGECLKCNEAEKLEIRQ